MSHFTVLVAADDEEQLEQRLLPFHEYECTGIEEYVEWVPADMQELEAKHKEYGKNESLEEFIPAWGNYRKNEEGQWGRMTNSDAKWDWWVIGGRWTGLLPLKDEAIGNGENGTPGVATMPNESLTHCDSALAGEIKWDAFGRDDTVTFAFINAEGQWYEKGRMGWWASVTDEQPDYLKQFWAFIDALPDDQRIYLVDCHI